MQDEIVFRPDRRGISIKHIALIFCGFLLFIQLLLLGAEPLVVRLAVTVALAVFLLLGLWLSKLHSQNWPQEIVLSRFGISYGNIKAMHGIELIPWNEIVRMDIFYTDPRLPPHLRIGLKPGAFRNQLKKLYYNALAWGWMSIFRYQ